MRQVLNVLLPSCFKFALNSFFPAIGANSDSDLLSNATLTSEGDANATTSTPAVKPKRVACLLPESVQILTESESGESEDVSESEARGVPVNADPVSVLVEESGEFVRKLKGFFLSTSSPLARVLDGFDRHY